MKKISIRKLAMKRETLRTLAAPDMARVAGGAYSDRCSQYCSRIETRCDCETVTRDTCGGPCNWTEKPCTVTCPL